MSKRTSPHVLTVMEADMSRVSKHRAANKSAFERWGQPHIYGIFYVRNCGGIESVPNRQLFMER